MSNKFRQKAAPGYRYPMAEMDLSAWLEDRVCATVYGPSGTGKSEFLRDYFNEERCLELAMQEDDPLLVLWWSGSRLAGLKNSTQVLYHVYRDAYRKAEDLGMPGLRASMCPPESMEQTSAEKIDDLKLEWDCFGAKILLVVEKFNRFMCVLGDEVTGRAEQIDILNLRDLPMIVSNDFVYTAQYCPAIEQVRGSNIFNDLARNYLVLSAYRPTAAEFASYLQRSFRGGELPFEQDEMAWLLQMTGGFPALVPAMADALYDAKQQGMEGLAAQEQCLTVCLAAAHPVSRQLQQWVKDLTDAEYNALVRLAGCGAAGGALDYASAPALDRGLYYLDRERNAHLCADVLREYLCDPANARAAAPAAEAATLLPGLGGGPIHVEKMIVVQGSNNVLEGDRKVQVVAAGNDPNFWQELLQNMHTLSQGSSAVVEQVGNQLAAIQRPDADATEEEGEEWAAQSGANILTGMSGAQLDLDSYFAQLCARTDGVYPQQLQQLAERLPQSTAMVLKQSLIVDDLFTGTLQRFGIDHLMDFSPCALLYGILLEYRMKEVLVPLYTADPTICNLMGTKEKRWRELTAADLDKVTIGNLYGGKHAANRKYLTDRMAVLCGQTHTGKGSQSWWANQYERFIRAGDLRNNAAHASRMSLQQLEQLRNYVLGHPKAETSLLNLLNQCCRMDVALNYHTCAQVAAADEWRTAQKLQQYNIF